MLSENIAGVFANRQCNAGEVQGFVGVSYSVVVVRDGKIEFS
jgi:hypothetical protein